MKIALSLILTLSLLSPTLSQTPDFVAEIFRHGIRSPQPKQYDSSWAANGGYSELTTVGVRQQYTLGVVLSKQYPSLLIPATMSSVYVLSTSDNRTISSALSQLYGIYHGIGPDMPVGYPVAQAHPPYTYNDYATIDTDTGTAAAYNKFMPIPVHTIEKKDDYLLESYLNCQNANPWFTSMNTDSTVTGLYETINTMGIVNNLKALGLTINSYSDFNDLGDTVIANEANGKPLPGGILSSSPEYKALAFYTQWYNVYASLTLPKQRQLFSGPFLYNFLNYIKLIQANKSTPKFAFFAAKESMLATLLAAFGVMTPQCLRENWEAESSGQPLPHPLCKYPVYASSIVFEFYKATATVKVKYNGDYLQLCGGTDTCSLADFQAYVDTVTDKTDLGAFMTKCGNNPTTTTGAATATGLIAEGDDKLRPYDSALIALCVLFFTSTAVLGTLLFLGRRKMRIASPEIIKRTGDDSERDGIGLA